MGLATVSGASQRPLSSSSPHEGRVSPARSQQHSGGKSWAGLNSAPCAALLCSQAPGLRAEPGTGRSLSRLIHISEHHRVLRFEGSPLRPEWSRWWKTGLGPVLQLTVLDPPGPSKTAVGGKGALQVDARVWHLHVVADRLSIFGHQAESCGWDLWVEQTRVGRVACGEKPVRV